jgi:hypothetical protein
MASLVVGGLATVVNVDERTKQTIWFVLMPALAAVFRALSTLGVE